MSEYKPEFIGGPKDGSSVPLALWILDTVEMVQHLHDGNMIYLYEIDSNSKNYIYKGQILDKGDGNE